MLLGSSGPWWGSWDARRCVTPSDARGSYLPEGAAGCGTRRILARQLWPHRELPCVGAPRPLWSRPVLAHGPKLDAVRLIFLLTETDDGLKVLF